MTDRTISKCIRSTTTYETKQNQNSQNAMKKTREAKMGRTCRSFCGETYKRAPAQKVQN